MWQETPVPLPHTAGGITKGYSLQGGKLIGCCPATPLLGIHPPDRCLSVQNDTYRVIYYSSRLETTQTSTDKGAVKKINVQECYAGLKKNETLRILTRSNCQDTKDTEEYAQCIIDLY